MSEQTDEYQPAPPEEALERLEAEHWPSERMITEESGRYAAWASEEDLQELGDEELRVIAALCKVETVSAEECIPCTATVLLAERWQERHGQSGAAQGEEEIPFEQQNVEFETSVIGPSTEIKTGTIQATESILREGGVSIFAEKPVAQVFAEKVSELRDLTEQILDGPPIPPPGVTLEELSLLVVGAQRWIKITEAQGVDLAPQQAAVLDATKTLVARLHRG